MATPKNTTTDLAAGVKLCGRCKTTKSVNEFYADRSRPDGLQRKCKSCSKEQQQATLAQHREYARRSRQRNPERHRGYKQRYVSSHPTRSREYALRTKFGLTLEAYEQLLLSQSRACAICGVSVDDYGRAFDVDHNHTTGAVRGLLCGPCNKGLGCLKDDPERVAAALSYLKGKSGD